MNTRLTLAALNANVVAVHTVDGTHVGNLKRIGIVWKFKAVGQGPDGGVEPGGGPLTHQHNTVFDTLDESAVNERLGRCI